MANPSEYQGTKLQEFETMLTDSVIEKSKILIITDDNQFLISFDKLVEIINRRRSR